MPSVSSLERAAACRKLATGTGISRQGLYKAIAEDGNPSFETVMKIVGAFGVRLSAQAAADRALGKDLWFAETPQ